MAYTTIPSSDYDVDSPLTTGLMGNIINNIEHSVERTRRLLNFFGDGANGVITYSSNQNVATGIYCCTNWTLNSGVTITLTRAGQHNTFILLCTGTATIQGTINGAGGSSIAGRTYQLPAGGGSGGGGGSGQSVTVGSGGDGGDALYNEGGAGSTGASGTPGGAGVAIDANVLQSRLLMHSILAHSYSGGNGGNGGAADPSGNIASGGGAGVGLIIIANTINFTSSGTINTNGGAGVAGISDTSSGGGGGGGGAGAQLMAADTYTNNAGTRTFSGGAGGAAGGGAGSSAGGAGGAGTSLIVFSDPRS